jgi:tetrapyrrole methylase family protein/MazG family protein
MPAGKKKFDDFVKLIALLRAPGGCPWDRKQSHISILPNLIEETYELVDAIEKKDLSQMKEELGDLLLQVVFHAQMEAEKKRFNIDDVITSVHDKIVRRHPHVFKKKANLTAEKVLQNWEKIKLTHREESDNSTFSGLPRHLPALVKAYRVQEKSARIGFVWQSPQQILAKLREELRELEQDLKSGRKSKVRPELGDLFLALVSLSWWFKKDPETILRNSVDKFVARFQRLEKLSAKNKRRISQLKPAELQKLWQKTK